MDHNTIWAGFVGMVSALGVVAAFFGGVEAVFKPVRKALDRRDKRIQREARIENSLLKLNDHFLEANTRDKKIEALEKRMDDHKDLIDDSREERRILWQGMRAILQALRPLVPEDESIRKALLDMDDYANKQMRR